MKRYISIDDRNVYHIDYTYDKDKQKNSKEFSMILDIISNPYDDINSYEKIVSLINPDYDRKNLSIEVLNRELYLNHILEYPNILYGLREVYTIDNFDDCNLLINKKDNHDFYIQNKDKLNLFRDYIIQSDIFLENLDKNITSSSIRSYMAYKCPELIIGFGIQSINGDLDYKIKRN